MLKVSLAILIIAFLISCKDKTQTVSVPITILTPKNKITNTPIGANKVKATDYVFFNDSVLHGHKAVLKYYFNKYGADTTCSSYWHFYDKKDIEEGFRCR